MRHRKYCESTNTEIPARLRTLRGGNGQTYMVQTRLMPLAATIIISDPYCSPNRHAAGSSVSGGGRSDKWSVDVEDNSQQPSSESDMSTILSEPSNGLFVRTDSLPIVVENDDATSQSSRSTP